MKTRDMIIASALMALMCAPTATAADGGTGTSGDEIWEMTYDDYQSLISDNPEFRGHTREVRVSRTETEFTIYGMFAEYPDAAIRGYSRVRLHFYYDQQIGMDGETPIYMNLGTVTAYDLSQDDRQYTIGIKLTGGLYLSWEYGEEGANKDLWEPLHDDNAIWLADCKDNNELFARTYYYDGSPTGDDFEARPIIVAPTFRKIGEAGVVMPSGDDAVTKDQRVFDLSGRQVNPDDLAPGIYIRGGRKFVVR